METQVLDKEEILAACTRFLSRHPARSVAEQLQDLINGLEGGEVEDTYGKGALVENFEAHVAALLGKESAVFMPSGTMAQQIALRIHTERSKRFTCALHWQSHLVMSEENAYQTLHPIRGIMLGERDRLFTLDDIKAIPEQMGSILIELPERNLGGALRSWDDLVEISTWARRNTIPLHLDGARLWESAPYYGRSYAEIASCFDTVYVSFYKMLGGIAGSILAGEKSFIQEARIWQNRLGGRLIRQYPMVLSAKQGLLKYLPRIPTYYKRAQEIAGVLSNIDGVLIKPDPPQAPLMHVYLRGDTARLNEATLYAAQKYKIWPGFTLKHSQVPSYSTFELGIGEGACAIPDAEIRELFLTILEYAHQES